ncbi:MAG: hypothetical protein WCK25_04975, partial [Actinomycetes bacterium]
YQLSGLHILHQSAKSHTGARHALISTYFDERFDEKGANLITDGKLILRLNSLELAMDCLGGGAGLHCLGGGAGGRSHA